MTDQTKTEIAWISGPTGSGKTTLANGLTQGTRQLVREVVPQELFKQFLTAPQTYCYRLQRSIIQSRVAQLEEAVKSGHSKIILDRSPEEDVKVFCRMYRDLGYLSVNEYADLEELAESAVMHNPPCITIFLSTPFSVVKQRLESSGYPKFILNNLSQQFLLYDEWQKSKNDKILLVDSSRAKPGNLGQWIGIEC